MKTRFISDSKKTKSIDLSKRQRRKKRKKKNEKITYAFRGYCSLQYDRPLSQIDLSEKEEKFELCGYVLTRQKIDGRRHLFYPVTRSTLHRSFHLLHGKKERGEKRERERLSRYRQNTATLDQQYMMDSQICILFFLVYLQFSEGKKPNQFVSQ